jgi:hypothetical protein
MNAALSGAPSVRASMLDGRFSLDAMAARTLDVLSVAATPA